MYGRSSGGNNIFTNPESQVGGGVHWWNHRHISEGDQGDLSFLDIIFSNFKIV